MSKLNFREWPTFQSEDTGEMGSDSGDRCFPSVSRRELKNPEKTVQHKQEVITHYPRVGGSR
ncbi:MAG: hypothetical protein Tsb009_29850 [Planctomycetaceae bacterium]